jgi:hypothetical protein
VRKVNQGGAPANYTDLVETEITQRITKNSFPRYAKDNEMHSSLRILGVNSFSFS